MAEIPQVTKNEQSSKIYIYNKSKKEQTCSEEMANEEGKSTGDIISLIFKGQKSMELFMSHFKEKTGKKKGFLFLFFLFY